MYVSKYPGTLGYEDEICVCRLIFSFQVTTELAAFVLIISSILHDSEFQCSFWLKAYTVFHFVTEQNIGYKVLCL